MFILREGSETYRVALEAAPLLVIDADFRVRYMNTAARREYQYRGALPVPCYTLSHGLEEPCPGECPLRSILETGQPRVCVHRHRHEEIQRYEKILASPVYDTRGHLRGIAEILVDVTPQIEMELQLQEARKREALCRVAGGLAHQFNNLLMVIQGLSELVLLDLGQEHRLSSHIQRILQACYRGAEIIRKLLSFSGQRVEPKQTLNLSEFLKRAEPLLRSSAGNRIKLKVEVPSEPLPLRGNEEILLQILLPLVANAREAMPRGGELRIKAYRKDREICLEVRDSGRGIPKEDLPHIFDPFFTTKELGAGLGLSVVSGSVRALKGRIEVESFPGRGTLFRLYFPPG
ncbi:MAG TPA: hypothetical protein ENJ40_00760 [Thermosulfurimonas dismutans]|uniref:histidine kinase n=1 Tax=Thermosulfurimonas dismutans TaxID=999894 RepID=A0A7C3CJH9_9BACT|nr:hypothetical protein [Thermosulfurimonas dismutans]